MIKYEQKTDPIKKDTVDVQTTTEDKTIEITTISKPRTIYVWYSVQIKICAGNEKLYSPNITISSDRDSVDVVVWGIIMPKACQTREFFIRADDPNSISARFSDQTNLMPKMA